MVQKAVFYFLPNDGTESHAVFVGEVVRPCKATSNEGVLRSFTKYLRQGTLDFYTLRKRKGVFFVQFSFGCYFLSENCSFFYNCDKFSELSYKVHFE